MVNLTKYPQIGSQERLIIKYSLFPITWLMQALLVPREINLVVKARAMYVWTGHLLPWTSTREMLIAPFLLGYVMFGYITLTLYEKYLV